MEVWIKHMNEEQQTAAEHATADAQDKSDREVSTRWRFDTVIRQRNRLPVVTRELRADEDYIDLTDDESLPPSPLPNTSATVSDPAAAAPLPTTPVRGRRARGRGVSRTPRSSRGNSSDGRSASNVARMFMQMEERRLAAKERRDAAIAAAEERREAREVAAREREAAIREREITANTVMMQQITSLVQHVIQRPQYCPPQRQLAPGWTSTAGGAFDENTGHPPGPTSP
jgi:hypothetical protein